MKLKIDMPAEIIRADLEKLIPKQMEKVNVPGLSIALIRDAKVIWSKGFGVKSVASKEPITTNSVFSAQSLSKPVFAYTALKMCERSALDLNTPLTEYLPEPYIPDDPHLELITMRHVLSHTSGFPNWRPRGKPLKVLFTPGERFSYSGEGYVYLQKVVEHLSGQPLAEYMKVNLLEPFGMRNSSYIWTNAYEREAKGHDREGKPIGIPSWHNPNAAGSLYSTPTDLARFIIEIMQPSRKDEFHLSDDMVEEMLKPQISVYFSISWGLGWGIQHSEYSNSFWQWGEGYREGCFQHFAVAFKAQRIGVVIMTNSANGLRICEDIIVQAIGGEHPAFSDYLKI